MKKTVSVIIIVLLLFCVNLDASAQTFEFNLHDETNLYQNLYDDFNVNELIENSPKEVQQFTDDFDISITDPFSFNNLFSEDGFEYLKEYFLNSIKSPFKNISIIIISIIICALCFSFCEKNLQANYSFNLICTLSAITLLILPISSIIENAVSIISTISVFMGVFIPIFAGILIAALKSGTAAMYSSTMFFVCEAITYICNNYLLPLINCFTALSVTCGLSASVRLSGITKTFKKICYILISTSMSVFLAVLSIQSVVVNATDNAATKTAKFFISSFVPVIGPAVSESLGSLRGCISLLKASTGIYAVIAIIVVVVPLIVEIVIYKLGFTFCADLAELFSVDSLKNILESVNQSLSLILSVTLCVSLMFIFSITIISVFGGSV